jgi:G3E family GTPase
VLTGYLGAGKTTLLNRILSTPHGKKYAVIVNEFGEIGIDNDLIVGADEEIFEMNNGCICCTVRGDLIRIISGLMKRARNFDGILIETTGLADPGPVAQTFFADRDISARAKLDGIVTVADAKNLRARLADSKEAVEQIAFADVVLLNKIDLVSKEERSKLAAVIHSINRHTRIAMTERCEIDPDKILGLGSFDLNRILEENPDFLGEDDHEHHDHHHDHISEAGITSISLSTDKPIDPAKFENWIGELRANKGQNLLRYKGILDMAGSDAKLALQGVHMMMDASNLAPWKAGEKRQSRLVFIGRDLDEAALRAGFASTHS